MKFPLLKSLEHKAFTRFELLVVLLALTAMICVLPWTLSAKQKAARINCASNLKLIGVAFSMFAAEHGNNYPMQVSTNLGGSKEYTETPIFVYKNFTAIANQLADTRLLVCPKDRRLAAPRWNVLDSNQNVSYFVALDATPGEEISILAGDRNVTKQPGTILSIEPKSTAAIRWESSVGLHKDEGHLLFADGHVNKVDSLGLDNALRRRAETTNRLAIP